METVQNIKYPLLFWGSHKLAGLHIADQAQCPSILLAVPIYLDLSLIRFSTDDGSQNSLLRVKAPVAYAPLRPFPAHQHERTNSAWPTHHSQLCCCTFTYVIYPFFRTLFWHSWCTAHWPECCSCSHLPSVHLSILAWIYLSVVHTVVWDLKKALMLPDTANIGQSGLHFCASSRTAFKSRRATS